MPILNPVLGGSDTSDATAAAKDILDTKTAYVDGEKVTGNMPNNGAKTASLNAGGSYTIPAGYHNGSGKVTANSLASQTSGTATASDMLSGETAWVNGSKITGTMSNKGAVSQTLNAGESYTIPAGYHSGGGKVTANSLASQTTGTAITSDILAGETAWVNGNKVTGNMPNNGAKTASLNADESYTIPTGYHNGSGKVTANSLASQTSGTAIASDILSGETAWVNGNKVTGTLESSKPGIIDATVVKNALGLNGLKAVCYGNEKFVVVGEQNNILYSTDGTTWTNTMISDESHDLLAVCYGNNKFVAVGATNLGSNSLIEYSTDGIEWTIARSHQSIPVLYDVCYGNGKFVAVSGTGETIEYSYNGIDWYKSPVPFYTDHICYGNGKFIAASGAFARYSTDGIAWTEVTLPIQVRDVCYGNGKFVAIETNSNKSAYSTDGITWTESTLPNSQYWNAVCYGNGGFVAVCAGNSNNVAYSIDGVTWATFELSELVGQTAVCYGDNKFVIVSDNGDITILTANMPPNSIDQGTAKPADVREGVTFTSNEGFTLDGTMRNHGDISQTLNADESYTIPAGYHNGSGKITANSLASQTPGTAIASDIASGEIAWVNGNKVIGTLAANQPGITDINTFAFPSGVSGYPDSICYGNGVFIVISGNKYWYNPESLNSTNGIWADNSTSHSILRSTDGETWEIISLPYDRIWTSISYGNGVFAITGYSSNFMSNDAVTLWSTDGLKWIEQAAGSDVIYYNDKKFFLADVEGCYIFTTINGVTWTKANASSQSWVPWSSVCYGKGYFFALGGNMVDDSHPPIYSSDGIYWSKFNLPADMSNKRFSSICYGNGKIIAIVENSNEVLYATMTLIPFTNKNIYKWNDGYQISDWNKTTLPSSANWTSVCYGNGIFIVIAYNSNKIAYSTDGITWTEDTIPTTANWRSICYGNGRFVATADDGVSIFDTCIPSNYLSQENIQSSDVCRNVTFTSNKEFLLDGTFHPHRSITITAEIYRNSWASDLSYELDIYPVNTAVMDGSWNATCRYAPHIDSTNHDVFIRCSQPSSNNGNVIFLVANRRPSDTVTVYITFTKQNLSTEGYAKTNAFIANINSAMSISEDRAVVASFNIFTLEDIFMFEFSLLYSFFEFQDNIALLQQAYEELDNIMEPEKIPEVNYDFIANCGADYEQRINDMVDSTIWNWDQIRMIPLTEPYTILSSRDLQILEYEEGQSIEIKFDILPGLFSKKMWDSLKEDTFIVATIINGNGLPQCARIKYIVNSDGSYYFLGTFPTTGIIAGLWISDDIRLGEIEEAPEEAPAT